MDSLLFLFSGRLFDVDQEIAEILWSSLQRHNEGLWDVQAVASARSESETIAEDPWVEGGGTQQMVSSWLRTMDLQHLAEVMAREAVVTVADLLTLIVEKTDLTSLLGTADEDCDKLWSAIALLNQNDANNDATDSADIGQWLQVHGYSHYESNFRSENINSVQELYQSVISFSDMQVFGFDVTTASTIWKVVEQDRPEIIQTEHAQDPLLDFQEQLSFAERDEQQQLKIISALEVAGPQRSFKHVDTLGKWVSDVEFFKKLSSKSQRHELCRCIALHLAVKDSVIFTQGDTGDRFFAIIRGKVSLHVDDRLVKTMGVGECFGEGGIINEDQVRGGTVKALLDTHLATLTAEDFTRCVRTTSSDKEFMKQISRGIHRNNSYGGNKTSFNSVPAVFCVSNVVATADGEDDVQHVEPDTKEYDGPARYCKKCETVFVALQCPKRHPIFQCTTYIHAAFAPSLIGLRFVRYQDHTRGHANWLRQFTPSEQ
eukprot:SAG31_NODE_823_length_11772_cov_10.262229_8_plen_487_part_00